MTSGLLATDRSTTIDHIGIIIDVLVSYIKQENMRGHFDVNKLSEDFFCVILNEAYDLKLVNLNKTGKMNYKDIDLADDDAKISYQVTSENNKAKVKKHVEGFEADKKYTIYPSLRFLILDRTRDQKIKEVVRDGEDFKFDGSIDVICIKDLLLTIEGLSDDKVASILTYLKKEIPLWRLLVEEDVDDEIVHIVNEIVEHAGGAPSAPGYDYLETEEKIKLNFNSDEDSEYISAEYQRCLSRFKTIESILAQGDSDQEIILQSSMSDLYNKLKRDNSKSNREIFNQMIDEIEAAVHSTERRAARRLAIKSLVMFHFEDCTIFERTEKEKERLLVK